MTGWLAAIAFQERSEARRNLYLAKDTVDSLLSSAGDQAGQIAADSPDVEQFRRRLIEQAKQTYAKILARNSSPELGEEMALVDMRLGDGNRLTGQTEQAIAAIERLRLREAPQNLLPSFRSQSEKTARAAQVRTVRIGPSEVPPGNVSSVYYVGTPYFKQGHLHAFSE